MLTSFAGSRADYRNWLNTVRETHQRQIRVRVLNLNHDVLAEPTATIEDSFIDGQVTLDTTRAPTRILNLSLFDPSRSIGWEPDTVSSLPTHLRRMVRVDDGRAVPGLGWVWCPVFCGPVDEFDRDGAQVNIAAQGKEVLAQGSFGRHYEWASKRRVVAVIGEILELAGEAPGRIHLPDHVGATLPERLNVSRDDEPWQVAKKLARSINRVLFYDGRGHVYLRRLPKKPTLVIDRQSLVTGVKVDRQPLEFHNRWIVVGAKPKGSKKRVSADIALPKKHPLSAQSLARSGRPRWQIRAEEEHQVKSLAKVREIARDMRDDQQVAAQGYSFDCLPFPHVQEYDLVRAVDPLTGPVNIRVRQATLPLNDGAMSIGSLKRLAVMKKGHRSGVIPGGTGGL